MRRNKKIAYCDVLFRRQLIWLMVLCLPLIGLGLSQSVCTCISSDCDCASSGCCDLGSECHCMHGQSCGCDGYFDVSFELEKRVPAKITSSGCLPAAPDAIDQFVCIRTSTQTPAPNLLIGSVRIHLLHCIWQI